MEIDFDELYKQVLQVDKMIGKNKSNYTLDDMGQNSLDKLITHYEEEEDYEKCSKLLQIKNSYNNEK